MSSTALHDAVRRYLLERQGDLAEKTPSIERPLGQVAPEEARQAATGWAAFGAAQQMQLAFERTDASDFATREALQAFIQHVASAGPPLLGQPDADRVRQQATVEEQQRLVAYVERLTDAAAETLPPMPHRRELTSARRRSTFHKRAHWPPQRERQHDFWHPYDALANGEALHLQTAWFDVSMPAHG